MRTREQAAAGWTRREFLQASGMGALGLGLKPEAFAPRPPRNERSVILLLLVGGPSQIDTFDPKPDAPSDVRGPFRPIATAVPGVQVCEHLPGLARRMDRIGLIRSVYHDAAPIHETGFQLIQTGRLSRLEGDYPHVGSLASRQFGASESPPTFALLPAPLGNTGVGVWRGQSAGPLGPDHDPLVINPDTISSLDPNAYGDSRFGRSCQMARRLVENGSRFVVVNMYDTVFNQASWDCHGSKHFSTLGDYRDKVLPAFDRAYCSLLDDLERTGRLDSTLLVATGEFGRSPKLNRSGGRDHWPSVWTALVAGGGTPGGRVIGRSDAEGAEPADDPYPAGKLAKLMAEHLSIDLDRPDA
ncbi:MAG: DUF1501 domain-containing protein [Isosphaeraceae bacterium]